MASDKLFQKRQAASAEALKRRRINERSENKTYLIVCEGHTEKNYFRQLCGGRTNVNVTLDGGQCPVGIVTYAFENAEEYDAVICVFDHDKNQEKFSQARKMIKHPPSQYRKNLKNKKCIEAASNRCFEIWFLLHFSFSTKAFDCCDDVIAMLRTKTGFEKYKKADGTHYKLLADKTATAIANARKLEKSAEASDSPNPMTTVHHAVDYLLKEFREHP